MQTTEEPELSVVMRFHDMKGLRQLEDALFSLCGATGVKVNPIIVTQEFAEPHLTELRGALHIYAPLLSGPPRIVNVKSERQESDQRASLLNAGLNAADSRYVAFLDFDDVVYPSGYHTLITALRSSGAAIAFGRIVTAEVSSIRGEIYIHRKDRRFNGRSRFDLFANNFCPIHSFVLDTSLVSKDDLWFPDQLAALEDYHFLLRIVAKYPADFSSMVTDVAEYRLRSDHTMAEAPTRVVDLGTGESVLAFGRRLIDDLKRQTSTEVALSQFERLKEDWAGAGPFRGDPHLRAERAALRAADALYQVNSLQGLIAGLMRQLDRSPPKCTSGFVEELTMDGAHLEIVGWAYDPDTATAPHVFAMSKSGSVFSEGQKASRPDVQKALSVQTDALGFRIRVRQPVSRDDVVRVYVLLNEGLCEVPPLAVRPASP
jgi:hypothetical protein